MKLISFVCSLLLASVAVAQLPTPSFPPITTTNFYGGNCNSAQPAEIPAPGSTDAQKHRMYILNPPPFAGQSIPVGSWITHETWYESSNSSYLCALLLDAGPGACWNTWVFPPVVLGAPFMAGSNHLLLPSAAVTIYPTHAILFPFTGLFYYVGYQVPPGLAGHGVVAQWARLDPNGSFYLSSTRGYNVQ